MSPGCAGRKWDVDPALDANDQISRARVALISTDARIPGAENADSRRAPTARRWRPNRRALGTGPLPRSRGSDLEPGSCRTRGDPTSQIGRKRPKVSRVHAF